MQITNCQVNHLSNPVGYSFGTPVFHWTVEGSRGTRQTEARILVRRGEACIRDTGFAELDSLAVPLSMDLEPRTGYSWTVTVRSDAGEETESPTQYFETGKMNEPWEGKWIRSDSGEKDRARHPVFSKRFRLARPVRKARLYLCGLGMFDAELNGKRIGNEYLTPYCNNYNAFVQAITFDVTDDLKTGENTLSIALGNGWYNGRFGFVPGGTPYYGTELKLIAELRFTGEDGQEQIIGTDESWEVTRSNLTFSNIYDGEHRDDTLPPAAPEKARNAEAPAGKLTDRYSIPVVIREERPAESLIRSPKDESIFDFGQNLAGSFRLRIHGVPKGETVRVQVGEVLQEGCFYNDNLRSAKAEYLYISDGTDMELQPRFTFYGYRYAKVSGVPNLRKEDMTALVMYSDMEEIGALTTGHAKINRLILNAEWGKRGNFIDVPTDCPQRDERMGWTGDAEVFSPTALLQSDAYAFYRKYLYDMATEQAEHNGGVPDVIPAFGVYNGGTCAWGDATTIIPWNIYQATGDPSILSEHYEAMKAWVDFMEREESRDHAYMKKFHYGDWLALDGDGGIDSVKGGTSDEYCAEVYYLYSTRLVAETAKVLKKEDDAAHYTRLAEEILQFINDEFFSVRGRATIDTQTGYLLALRHGLGTAPERNRAGLIRKLEANRGKLQTGFIGTPILAETLTEIGAGQKAWDLLFNEEFPGWLYEVNLGATTIWERWNSMLADGSVSSTGMNSFNHYSYGAIVSWIYERVAGLRRDPAVPGYRKVLFTPMLNKKLGFVRVRYASAAGTWEAGWKVTGDRNAEITLTVPFGCTAEVRLPLVPSALYRETGNPLFSDVRDGICNVGPGNYRVSYEATAPLRKVYSVDTPICELTESAPVREVLQSAAPGLLNVYAQFRSLTPRQLAATTGEFTEAQLAQLNAQLEPVED